MTETLKSALRQPGQPIGICFKTNIVLTHSCHARGRIHNSIHLCQSYLRTGSCSPFSSNGSCPFQEPTAAHYFPNLGMQTTSTMPV